MTECASCKEKISDGGAISTWFWLRRGEEGNWFCSKSCISDHLKNEALTRPFSFFKPTQDEEARMRE